MKNKKYLYLLLFIIPIIVFFVGKSFSITYTEEIRNVEIESNDYDEPGSWHIDKSAKWTGFGKARVTFDVNSILKTVEGRYKDVIFVIDISGSMSGDKLDKAKQDAIDLTNYLLSNNHNSIALVTFETTSTIISDFTNDKDTMLNYLNSLSATGCTNYNAGLLNVDTLMNNYIKNENRDLIVLFLTDGYPNEDTPNEKATYGILKDKYPYMIINGIQYEMGKDIIQEIIDISDNQWVADQDTLHNVLFDATVTSLVYDNFVITDYINDEYFYLTSVENIKVDRGEVTLTEENGVQKIVWNLGDSYKTGDNIKMTIDLDLKSEYHNTKGYYPTNKSETIKSKLPDEEEKTVNSTLTPVLKNTYYVIYDTNKPDGCNIVDYDPEEHYVYETVTKKTDNLVCPDYLFKGWVIDDNDKTDMTIVNDDMFVMLNHDVHIRATWAKSNMVKTMDGTVYEKTTLYKVLEKAANNGVYAKKYNDEHQDSIDGNGNKNIYYWYASDTNSATEILNKNNVIFANHCWQMIRTTDTGGVKMIYNGEPEDDSCLNNRENHAGYVSRLLETLLGNYYYGTSYIYDRSNGNFSIDGNIRQVEVTSDNASSTIPSLRGLYTCKKNSIDDNCTTLYLIDNYNTDTKAYTFTLDGNSHYSQIGSMPFNMSSNSPAYVGYMYNNPYKVSFESHNYRIFTSSNSVNNLVLSYYYSDTIDYGNIVENKYSLIDPHPISEVTDYNELIGKYIVPSSSSTGSAEFAYYVLSFNSSTMFQRTLSDGNLNIYMVIGDNYVENNDGTYTLINNDNTIITPITYAEWFNSDDFTKYKNKYVCDGTNTLCNTIKHIYSASSWDYYYWSSNEKYKYGEDVEYNNGTYTLIGDVQTMWDLVDTSENEKLYTHHYSCFNNSLTCSTSINYVINFETSGARMYYVSINNTSNIETALENMLSVYSGNNRVNYYTSPIKKIIDAWYKKNIYSEYDDYIEDVIYCNDRSINSKGAWDSNGGKYSSLSFIGDTKSTILACPNETDRFSIFNNKAKLTYKVGLPRSSEMLLLGNNALRKTGRSYRLLSPRYYIASYVSVNAAIGSYIDSSGGWGQGYGTINYSLGVRPVISLRSGIEYKSGDGSMMNPYIIDTDSD